MIALPWVVLGLFTYFVLVSLLARVYQRLKRAPAHTQHVVRMDYDGNIIAPPLRITVDHRFITSLLFAAGAPQLSGDAVRVSDEGIVFEFSNKRLTYRWTRWYLVRCDIHKHRCQVVDAILVRVETHNRMKELTRNGTA